MSDRSLVARALAGAIAIGLVVGLLGAGVWLALRGSDASPSASPSTASASAPSEASASTSAGGSASASASAGDSPSVPPSGNASPSASAAPSASPSATATSAPTTLGSQSVASAGVSPFDRCTLGGAGQVFPNSEVEATVAVDPRDPSVVVTAWQQDRWSTGAARGIVVAASRDRGRTWTRSSVPFSACVTEAGAGSGLPLRVSDPWLSYGPDGTAYLAGLGTTQPNVTWVSVSRSTDGGRIWSNPVPITRSTSARTFNDKEAVTADPTRPGRAYLVWDVNSAGEQGSSPSPTTQGSVLFATTTDGGATWSPARTIATMAGTPVGNIVAVTPTGTLVDVFVLAPPRPQGQAVVSALRSTDGGATWSAPATIATLAGADVIGAQPPGIRGGAGLPSVTVDPRTGTVTTVWADPRAAPAAVSLSTSSDGGATWTTPRTVPRPTTSAVFLATVATAPGGALGVEYTDLRAATPTQPFLADRFLSVTTDGGTSWHERRLTATFDYATAPNAGGRFLGDYAGLATSPDGFVSAFPVTTGDGSNPTDLLVRVDPVEDPGALALP